MTKIWKQEDLVEAMRQMALARLRLVSAVMGRKYERNDDEMVQARTAYAVAVSRYTALETALLSVNVNMTFDEREGREIALARKFILEAH